MVFIGALTAVGGGTIRDLIIGRTPLFYLKNPAYLSICLLAGIAAYFIPNFFKKAYSIFRLTDSIGLAAFVIIGVSVSYNFIFTQNNFSFIVAALSSVFMGMLTGFGGGVLRDAIMGDTPYALKGGSNYVSSAFWGSSSYFILMFLSPELAMLVSVVITLTLREVVSEFGIYKKVIRKNGWFPFIKR